MVAPEPVVVEFTVVNPNTGKTTKEFFMGATLDDVVADAQRGFFFDSRYVWSRRVVDASEAQNLGLDYYDRAHRSIKSGGQPSWYLEKRDVE